MIEKCLEVVDLNVAYSHGLGAISILNGVDFAIGAGEALALVGESGSGKSTAAMAIMGLLGERASVTAKKIQFCGEDIAQLSEAHVEPLRGKRMAMVFQDPFLSLNPVMTIGSQVAEPLRYHSVLAKQEIRERVIEALSEVAIRDPRRVAESYPHELSGGMRQRVLLAQAMIARPELLICDEPTTALDVTVEAQILTLIEKMRAQHKLSVLFISHNLAIVNRIADRICVLYSGQIVESGPKREVLGRPLHPYTKGLLAAVPNLNRPSLARLRPIMGAMPSPMNRPAGCIFEPRCPHAESNCRKAQVLTEGEGESHLVRCWKFDRIIDPPIFEDIVLRRDIGHSAPLLRAVGVQKSYRGPKRWRIVAGAIGGSIPALRSVSNAVRAVDVAEITIRQGETFALVGESGSGKSTLGQCVLRLTEPDKGDIVFDGQDITKAGQSGLRHLRKASQVVFQDTTSSLNPRRTIGAAIERSIRMAEILPVDQIDGGIADVLKQVGLSADYRHRYPHQLSGGERQRVGIARAIAVRPKLIVCDEPVSSLDVSVQASILHLLADLQRQHHLSYLFISHDLAVVATIADRIGVMFAGTLVEVGPTEQILKSPYHPYTMALLAAVPSLTLDYAPQETVADSAASAQPWQGVGCPFHGRCRQKIGAICETESPPLVDIGTNHWIRCHHEKGVSESDQHNRGELIVA